MDIYLVNNYQETQSLPFDTTNTKFVCFDWETYCKVYSKKIEAMAFDQYINQEEGESANEFVESLLKNWYLENNEDFTLFEGVSIGDCISWYMRREIISLYKFLKAIQKIIEIEKPKNIFYEESLGENKKTIIKKIFKNSTEINNININVKRKDSDPIGESLIDFEIKKTNLLSKITKKIYAFVTNTFWRTTDKPNRMDLLFTFYPSLLPIIDYIIKEKKEWNLHFGGSNPPVLLKEYKRAFPFVDDQDELKIDEEKQGKIRGIKERWDANKKGQEYRKMLECDGVEIEEVTLIIDKILHHKLLEVATRILRYREYLVKKQIRAVVVPFDITTKERIILNVAKILGIPSLVVLHGYPHPLVPPARMDNLKAEFTIVWGEDLKKNYEKIKPNQKIYALGNPKFDNYANLEATDRPKTKKILVLSSPKFYAGVFSPIFLSERYIREVIHALTKYNDYEITLKIHPSENIEYYKKLLIEKPEIKIVRNIPIETMLETADIVLCPFVTTAIFEAMAMKKKTLIINIPEIKFKKTNPELIGWEICNDAQTVKQKLEEMLITNQFNPEDQIKKMEGITGPIDGNSAKRVVELIEKICKKN